MLLSSLANRLRSLDIALPNPELAKLISQIGDILQLNFKIPPRFLSSLLEGLLLRLTQIADRDESLLQGFRALLTQILKGPHKGIDVEKKALVLATHRILKDLAKS